MKDVESKGTFPIHKILMHFTTKKSMKKCEFQRRRDETRQRSKMLKEVEIWIIHILKLSMLWFDFHSPSSSFQFDLICMHLLTFNKHRFHLKLIDIHMKFFYALKESQMRIFSSHLHEQQCCIKFSMIFSSYHHQIKKRL